VDEGGRRMRYTLRELKEYRDVLKEIAQLESRLEVKTPEEDGPFLGPKTLLETALEPLPEGATGRRRIPRDYRCSICNGEGHNARTCDTLEVRE
jgi:hypothetical protein